MLWMNLFRNFFGETLKGNDLQNLQTTLLKMGTTKYENLNKSMDTFATNLERFSPKQQKSLC